MIVQVRYKDRKRPKIIIDLDSVQLQVPNDDENGEGWDAVRLIQFANQAYDEIQASHLRNHLPCKGLVDRSRQFRIYIARFKTKDGLWDDISELLSLKEAQKCQSIAVEHKQKKRNRQS